MPEKKKKSPLKSSIVARLNSRLFLRLLGIYFGMDLLLSLLFCGGLLFWAEHQAADISALVEERGVPTAEATEWMQAGDYIVTAGDGEPKGFPIPRWRAMPDGTVNGERYFDPGDISIFFLVTFHTGGTTSYSLHMDNNGDPYTIWLDLSAPASIFLFASRVLLICQLLSLVSNLFKNAGSIKKVLRPIQELAATAARLNNVERMSPDELKALAGKLGEIDAGHLDERIDLPGTQKEL